MNELTANELAEAIAAAFVMVGRSSKEETRHHTALQHLQDLLEAQRLRAFATSRKD